MVMLRWNFLSLNTEYVVARGRENREQRGRGRWTWGHATEERRTIFLILIGIAFETKVAVTIMKTSLVFP